MSKERIIIAIDGYSSCGKSTLAKALSKRLNFMYVDSGAMYRAVTYYFLKHQIDINNLQQVEQALEDIHIGFENEGDKTIVLLNGEDITSEIREMRVSALVSEISSIKSVRLAMIKQQQRMGSHRNIVMDGRDIGTVVFPYAQIKVFMTADPKIRADRRFKELRALDKEITLEEVFENIAHRDFQDTTRKESPLIHAKDAITLDNTYLTESEQLEIVLKEVEKFCPRSIDPDSLS